MLPLPRRHAWLAGPPANTCSRNNPQNKRQQRPAPSRDGKYPESPPQGGHDFPSESRGDSFTRSPVVARRRDHSRGQHPSDTGATSKEKNNIVIPEFSAWLTLVLEQCRAENIRNLPRQRAPTPLFPERRPREACSMPISGCHDLPLATFHLPSRNNLQNKPNSAATMSLPCSRFATAQPQRRWDAPPGKQHRHSGIFRVADLGPGTMPRGKYPESPAPAGSHALISRTPTPGGMLHANLGLPRPPPRNFPPPLPQQPPKQTQQRRHNVPPVQSLRDSAAATPVGCAAWQTTSSFRNFPRG